MAAGVWFNIASPKITAEMRKTLINLFNMNATPCNFPDFFRIHQQIIRERVYGATTQKGHIEQQGTGSIPQQAKETAKPRVANQRFCWA
ncbi:MAG: hypothetical protein P5702_01395 [Limnospira sp. PMC 1291.21]|uniref:Uncharacterized protein n=1 Tax=Limnospira indica PCC 8005 TaxID=376219 RepID=A0A9P1KAH3_9CYAN|nr:MULTISPECIES: hypothetical protein [Limnospira]MDC0839110.1 hypothetical protein [Limnoraphis robusta]MDT9191550.1 hypothetical protein [Limnospira sp. PMC 1245.20]MDT9212161.1 hypothetical protein [Limnospira sp. PMC 1256.20]MDT9242504.1 hypothetical protein [Limnospira sp. PMC 1249.20]MDT9252853.1 hypothetical protein [Limnospira sp. PMC 1254.20]MDT9262925.1 hypothetical protein [Limnospira sp. PMC 1223.20]MDT9298887.1 hypothetical protein [Limnospira sp. PMC 1281.21]MDT9303944.1 hypot